MGSIGAQSTNLAPQLRSGVQIGLLFPALYGYWLQGAVLYQFPYRPAAFDQRQPEVIAQISFGGNTQGAGRAFDQPPLDSRVWFGQLQGTQSYTMEPQEF